MKDTNLESRIKEYLEAHPQYVSAPEKRALEGRGFTFEQHDDKSYPVIRDALISPAWITGGLTGGSCWGSNADQPVRAEEMPAWLEEFLEAVAPEVTFLKFRRLQERCTRYEYSVGGYYGNYSEYAFQVLKLPDLLEVLDA